MSYKNTIKDSLKLLPIIVISVFFLLVSYSTSLALGGNVSGFAWGAVDSDNNGVYTLPGDAAGLDGGIGWLSFDCTNTGSDCNTSNYNVNLDPYTGEFSGYAWSSNVGWISFDAGCPTYILQGGLTCEARVTDFINGTVEGWARACSVFQDNSNPNNPTCSGILKPDTERGGWDGWISMSGTNHPTGFFDGNGNPIPEPVRGVTIDTTTNPAEFSGYAWGGNDLTGKNNIGWISFGAGPVTTPGGGGSCPNDPSLCPVPIVTLTGSPTTVTIGQNMSVNLAWSTSNVINGCTISTEIFNDSGVSISTTTGWSGQNPSQSLLTNTTGNQSVVISGVAPDYIVRYHLECVGFTQTASTYQDVLVVGSPALPGTPTATIYAGSSNPTYNFPSNNLTFTLSFEADIPNPTSANTATSTTCSLSSSQNINASGWNGSAYGTPITVVYGPLDPAINMTIPSIGVASYPVTFSLTCTDADALSTIPSIVFVDQLPNIAFVTLSLLPPFNPNSNSATLSWNTGWQNVDINSCIGLYTVSGQSAVSWTPSNPAGTTVPYGSPSTLYTLSCPSTNGATPNPATSTLTLSDSTPPNPPNPPTPPIFEEF